MALKKYFETRSEANKVLEYRKREGIGGPGDQVYLLPKWLRKKNRKYIICTGIEYLNL